MHVCPTLTHWPFYSCHLTHFVIWPFLTFDPLSVGRTKRSPWTLLHHRPRLTHWPFHFCHLKHFVIWPFFDLSLTFLWPLTPYRGRRKRSLWTLMHVCPTPTHWHCYFCHLTHFVTWPFFDLWPLNRRLDEEVTVDTYACLPNTNTLTLLLSSFEVVCNLTSFFDPCDPKWPLIDM